MIKLNEEINDFNKLPLYVNQHLSFLDTGNIRFMIAVWTFLLLDLCALPLLYPRVNIIYYVTIPLLVFIHLWAIRLLIKNTYSTQFECLLFIGVHGVIGSICYFILIQKTAYFNLGIRAPMYYVISTILYLLITGILVSYQFYKYSSIKKKTMQSVRKEREKESSNKYGYVIVLFPALGYTLSQTVMKQSDVAMYSLVYFAFLLLSIVLAYFAAKYLHKYFFMKANMEFVRFQTPSKKEMKQAEAEGKEYIIK
ncbi:hypothetical protein [Virgibacillus halodenitrificans]|uniref:hypothetical protein n=1 Tax=Virgibacillus halodenitrificans TaxID=1482 RepID=UPI002DC01438|nr:hypothetical protein [Virgibacillus halodenitrificans]MEC2159606.1 hypothetical protein [Virgibacillus halodenitrificans]